MKQKYIYGIIIAAIIILGLITLSGDENQKTVTSFEECVAAGYPVMESYPRQCQTPAGETFVENVSGDENITITAPLPNSPVSDGMTVSGEARGTWFFEASFSGALYDANDREVATVILSTDQSWMTTDFVPFSGTLTYSTTPSSETGTLILRRANPSGLPENDSQVEIPVTFSSFSADTTNVFVYFPDPEASSDCSAVTEVARTIPKTEAVAKAALEELLRGTSDERYFSAIPSGTELNSVRIEDGVAYADFDERLQSYGGGSCNVQAIRAQITKTLQQFASVESVVISVNGETEGILEP